MRKTPTQARSRATVERILAAGRQVLIDDGYETFSTNRVAVAAGISPGSLYQYFADKASILDIVISRYWEDVSERTASALALQASSEAPRRSGPSPTHSSPGWNRIRPSCASCPKSSPPPATAIATRLSSTAYATSRPPICGPDRMR